MLTTYKVLTLMWCLALRDPVANEIPVADALPLPKFDAADGVPVTNAEFRGCYFLLTVPVMGTFEHNLAIVGDPFLVDLK